jgi:hypothetical protein
MQPSHQARTTSLHRQINRVCEVSLTELAVWQLEKVLVAMRVPYPELTKMELSASVEAALSVIPIMIPPIPDSFMGGSAPRLRHFELNGIPFPGLPKLLLSATHLVYLWLTEIPHSGYISPEAMVAPLSVLTSLDTLDLGFESPRSRPDRESTSVPPPKRSILPALRRVYFRGDTEYLEQLVTRIDTPQLDYMNISFFHQINFDISRLAQFINRTPTLGGAGDEALVEFDDWESSVSLIVHYRTLEIGILCRNPHQQLLSVTQVCNSSLHRLSAVGVLYIRHEYLRLVWKNDVIENTLWLQLLLPFTAVKNLYLSKEFAPGIAAALQELVGGRITEVLPSLQNIFVEGLEPSGPFQENIGQFVAARQLSDHPIAISIWHKRW